MFQFCDTYLEVPLIRILTVLGFEGKQFFKIGLTEVNWRRKGISTFFFCTWIEKFEVVTSFQAWFSKGSYASLLWLEYYIFYLFIILNLYLFHLNDFIIWTFVFFTIVFHYNQAKYTMKFIRSSWRTSWHLIEKKKYLRCWYKAWINWFNVNAGDKKIILNDGKLFFFKVLYKTLNIFGSFKAPRPGFVA